MCDLSGSCLVRHITVMLPQIGMWEVWRLFVVFFQLFLNRVCEMECSAVLLRKAAVIKEFAWSGTMLMWVVLVKATPT